MSRNVSKELLHKTSTKWKIFCKSDKIFNSGKLIFTNEAQKSWSHINS